LKLTTKTVSVGTYKVNATWTKEISEDLMNFEGFGEILRRQEVYEKRKRIIEKLLKEDKTNQ
jgi:hypothetical protein